MTEPAAEDSPKPEIAPNIVPGCIMMAVIAAVVIALASFTVMTGIRMNREIGSFSSDTPLSLPVQEPTPAMEGTLRAKLETIADAATEYKAVEVSLNADELNALIATRPDLESLRGKASVVRITPEAVVIAMSHPIRKFGAGERFLNGDYYFQPIRLGDRHWWSMALKDIQVPGKPVPRGFIDMIESLQLFRLDMQNAGLQKVTRQIEEVRLESGKMVIVTADRDLEAESAAGSRAQELEREITN